jgi:hypothetical protein
MEDDILKTVDQLHKTIITDGLQRQYKIFYEAIFNKFYNFRSNLPKAL